MTEKLSAEETMLRINLLPVRQLKKRAKARNQMIGFFMVFLAVLAVMGFIGVIQVSKVESVQAAIADLKKEEQRLAPIIKEVDELERQKKELERRIGIIEQLRRESSLTVHVLDEVAKTIDNERMWLTTMSQQGGSLSLQGVAMDNETIAQFMEALKTSPYVTVVNLSSSTLKSTGGRNFKNFSISCGVGFPKEEQDTEKGNSKK